MAAQRKPIKVNPDSELGLVLKRAAASGEPVLVETDDAVYELDVVAADSGPTTEGLVEDDAVLHLIGIGSSDEPTSIRREKDALLADAYEPRPR